MRGLASDIFFIVIFGGCAGFWRLEILLLVGKRAVSVLMRHFHSRSNLIEKDFK